MAMFITNPIINLRKRPIHTQQITCRKYKGFLPNITPAIDSLSSSISAPGQYSLVYINGKNFTPYNISVTFGTIQNIPIVYYSSFTISFVVPLYVSEGAYTVQVVANNNSNNALMTTLLYSNIVNYTIQNYIITGNYHLSNNRFYNTIIIFSANSTIVFYNTFNIVWNISGNAIVTIKGQPLLDGEYTSFINIPYTIILGTGSVMIYLNV
jgi:hypothetical protein